MIEVLPHLYQGDANDAINASKGEIVDVIVFLGQNLPFELEHSDVPVIHYPLEDGPNSDMKIEVLMDIFYSLDTYDFLVSCDAGLSRSPLMIMAYLMCGYEGNFYREWKFDQTYNFVKEKIPVFKPEQSLLAQIKRLYDNEESRARTTFL